MTTTIEYVNDDPKPEPTFTGEYVWSKNAKCGVYEATRGNTTIRVQVAVGDEKGCRAVFHPDGLGVEVWSRSYAWFNATFRYLGTLDGVVLRIRKAVQ